MTPNTSDIFNRFDLSSIIYLFTENQSESWINLISLISMNEIRRNFPTICPPTDDPKRLYVICDALFDIIKIIFEYICSFINVEWNGTKFVRRKHFSLDHENHFAAMKSKIKTNLEWQWIWLVTIWTLILDLYRWTLNAMNAMQRKIKMCSQNRKIIKF